MSHVPQSPSAALRPPVAGRTVVSVSLTSYGGGFQRRGRRLRAVSLLLDLLLEWQERARQRHDLRALDDRMLSDIGLTRADVEGECSKPFWRV